MILNEFGKIAYQEWENSAQIRQEIELDEFIIMPNHMHGIVIIRESTAPDSVQTHGHVSQQNSHVSQQNSQSHKKL